MFCSYVFEEFYIGNVTLKLPKMPSGLSRALVCVFLFLCVCECVCVQPSCKLLYTYSCFSTSFRRRSDEFLDFDIALVLKLKYFSIFLYFFILLYKTIIQSNLVL